MDKYIKYKRKYLSLKYKMEGGENKRVLVLCQRREYNDMQSSIKFKQPRRLFDDSNMSDSPFDDSNMIDSPKKLFDNSMMNFDNKPDDFIIPRKKNKDKIEHDKTNIMIKQYAEKILSNNVNLEFLSCTCGNNHISCDNKENKECSGVDYYFEFDPNNIDTIKFMQENKNKYSMIILYTCPKALMLSNESMLDAFNYLLEKEGKLILLSFDKGIGVKETIEHINTTYPYDPTKTQELYTIISKYFIISNVLTKKDIIA